MTPATHTRGSLVSSRVFGRNPFSALTVKVRRTGQIIRYDDTRYVAIYRTNGETYLFVYSFYSTLTKLRLSCEAKKEDLTVKVEGYRQGPIFKTSCDVYLADTKILADVDERSIGKQYVKSLEPARAQSDQRRSQQ